MKNYLILSLFLVTSLWAFSGSGSWSQRHLLSDITLSLNYAMSSPTWTSEGSQDYLNRVGLIHLDYTRKAHSDLEDWDDWRIWVTVDYRPLGGSTYTQKTLAITSETDLYTYSDYIKFGLGSVVGYEARVSSITGEYKNSLNNWIAVSSPQYDSHFPLDIDLRLELREEKWYDLDISTSTADVSVLAFDATSFRVNWSYIEGAEQYDFEWVWIDEESLEYSSLGTPPSGVSAEEWPFLLKKSSRVRVSHTHHVLDNTYAGGKLFFRVRGISKFLLSSNGGVIDQIKEGDWSYVNGQSNILSHDIQGTDIFEKEKNWLYGVAYAEEGKSVSSVTFYDGSNRGRQSLTYNTSDDITLIGETKFDREGRQTVSVIPAPVHGRSMGYRTGFNLANPPGGPGSTAIFDEEDFDFNNYLTSQTVPLQSNVAGESGAAKYFSSYNDFSEDLFRSAIPEANGYVYSQTVYRNDGSGRIERVGGIGQEFKVSGDHAVRTYYGSPSQAELKRLFGSNVADAPNGYRKEMVRDANGQFSVTYYDKRGNVIATALTGDSPENLLPIEGSGDVTITTSLSANNIVMSGGNSLVLEHTHLNQIEGDVITLDYDLQGVINTIGSQTISVEGQTYPFSELCATCEYDLKIEVKNQDGGYVAPSNQGTSANPSWYEQYISSNDACYVVDGNGDLQPNPSASVASLTTPSLTYTLPSIGEYRIIKTLTVNMDNMQENFNEQMDLGGVSDPSDFISLYTSNVDVSGCFDNCLDYCEFYALYQFLEDNPTLTEADWDPENIQAHKDAIEACMSEDCDLNEQYENFNPLTMGATPTINPISVLCDGYRDQMLDQISPGGAFYDNLGSGFWGAVATAYFGGYTSIGVVAQPSNTVTIEGVDYTFSELTNPSLFVPAIAEALLQYHREYCHINTSSGSSYCEEWAETMNYSNSLITQFTTTANAFLNYGTGAGGVFDEPYNQTTTVSSSDPFLSMEFNNDGSGNYDLLQEAVNDYYTFIDYANVPTAEQLCPVVSITGIPGTINFGPASGANYSASNLHTYVANLVNCMAQNDPNYPSGPYNLVHYDDLSRLLYKSLYDNIKQELVHEYVLSQGCLYYTDANAIILGPVSEQGVINEVTGGFGTVLAGIDCDDRAYTNAVDWINHLPTACLEALSPTYHQLGFGDNPVADEGTMISGANSTVSGSETLEQLFYDFTLATCPENTWGWFYDPDPNGTNPSAAGNAEYTGIYNLLSSTSGCGTTVLSSIEVVPAPTQSTSTFTNQNDLECVQAYMDMINDGLGLMDPYNLGVTGCISPYTSCSDVTLTVNGTNYPELADPSGCNMAGDYFFSYGYDSALDYYHSQITSSVGCRFAIHFVDISDAYGTGFIVSLSNPIRYANYTAGSLVNADVVLFDATLSNGNVVKVFLEVGLGYSNCPIIGDFSTQTITDFSGVFPTVTGYVEDCLEETLEQAEIDGLLIYQDMLEELQDQFLGSISSCLSSSVENFKMTYKLNEYQYTLYYYDLAGNLVQTVPPQGVDIVAPSYDALGNWNAADPVHRMETRYKYNGLNTLKAQYTPDGGHSDFVLDKLYRVRYSQNARQKVEQKASYTKYDPLGRVEEAGEMSLMNNPTPSDPVAYLEANVEDNNFPLSSIRLDHTITYYEEGYINDPSITGLFTDGQQKNLRNTIGAIEHVQADYQSGNATPLPGSEVRTVISYSYDPHKNVQEVVSTNYHLESIGEQHKTVRYEYDLISGNVNELIYQEDRVVELNGSTAQEELYSDEYRHQYHYDANNRLVRAFTSDDGGTTWTKEAKYFYYLHGALARTELGDDEVQGTDYAYNLQGWLKGVNASSLYASRDLGHDGDASGDNQYFGLDAHGFMLSYFDGDYQSIASTSAFADMSAVTSLNIHPIGGTDAPSSLYNGNIHNMTTALRDYDENKLVVLSNNYQYDQLQRIRSMKVYDSPSDLAASNHFGDAQLYEGGAYRTSYTFDKNGNLKTLDRYGDDGTKKMDEFTYNYYNTSSNGASLTTTPNESNRLANVGDLPSLTGNYTDVDIDAGQLSDNYQYDASGQLLSDEQEGIDQIVWSVTGKVKEIKFFADAGKNDLKFVYDPMDMRVMKIEYFNEDRTRVQYTYYSLDAQGNTLATYQRLIESPDPVSATVVYEDSYQLSEYMVYGSSRLGVDNRGVVLTSANITQPLGGGSDIEVGENFVWEDIVAASYTQSHRVVGRKYYELSNHLGNVLEVISDRKVWVANNDVHVYSADVVSYSDYFPYGMLLPGRHGEDRDAVNDYRYSFQGQEHDDEVKGKGNSVSYNARFYDPRIGRWFSRDEFEPFYTMWSTYCYAGNSPIAYGDHEGQWVKPEFKDKNNEAKYKKVVTQMKNYRLIGANYNLIHKKSRMDKYAKRNGIKTPANGLTLHIVMREMTKEELKPFKPLGPVDPKNQYGSAAGFFRPRTNGRSLREWKEGGEVKGLYYDVEVALGPDSYNLGTVSEELIHAGQHRYYKNENITVSTLHTEVEAKFIKTTDFVQNSANATTDPTQLMRDLLDNGFQYYEIKYLFKVDANGEVIFDSENKVELNKDAYNYLILQGSGSKPTAEETAAFNKALDQLINDVNTAYSNTPKWKSNQKVDRSLPYYEKLKKEAK